MKYLIQFCSLLLFTVAAFAQPSGKHDLHFTSLAKSWDEGIPLGNGMVGAIIWQKDGRLRFALDRSDLWDERPMKGLHRPEFSYAWVHEQVKKNDYAVVQKYFDAPYDREAAPSKISGGALEFESKDWGEAERVHLSLTNAVAEVKWKNGVVMKTFVHATEPVGWFRFENVTASFVPEIKTPGYKNTKGLPLDSLKSNDPAKLGYAEGTITKGNNSITYIQLGWNGFEYQIVVEWKQLDATTVEGVWSVSSNYYKQNKPASKYVQQAFKRTYNKDLTTHANWWKDFWSKSSISIPDENLETQYYREQYKFGATARKNAPPILLQGVWTADNGRLPPWKGDYHHDLNTEMSYWPAYSGNHLDEAMSFINHLEDNKDNYKRYTKLYFGNDGINVPGVSTLNGTEMGGWIQYALSPTVSGWLAHHYYLQWKYSNDKKFLKDKAYPWFREVAKYFEGITEKKTDGFRELPISSSPEINNNAINAWFTKTTNYDLFLIKFVFASAAEMATELKQPSEADRYRKILSEFRNYELNANNELMYAPAYDYNESHRHFSHAMAIHPLGLIKWEDGEKSRTIIKNTIAKLDKLGGENWNGYSYSWMANMKARAKDGEGAVKALEIFAKAFTSVNSFHVNGDQTKSGYSKRTYRPFTLEGNFAFASGLQDMLLQSYAGFIEVFPAIPSSWKNTSFTTLRAEGAYLVSATMKDGKVKEVKIYSEKGGTTRLKLPASNYTVASSKRVYVSKMPGDFVELCFKKDGVVVLSF
ncbi:glycosyl hydrolase family 95 catalytic domain-containing protein [Aridibaculum aurantiacum]|uniref:glycosyl hydrolase family 95 catalytic domain-containing protein n=1 Tax=Aridibaculum aurantiacum TaxID=2810307 RepID=UPI001A976ED5|nr:hypothetical protein [Aridibaculum aurantiacum]